MLSVALRPKWLGLLGVVLAVIALFIVLGLWQLGVATNDGANAELERSAAQPAVPVEQALKPHAEFPDDASGRPITATGSYDPVGQIIVTGRRLHGVTGYWVLAPLRMADGRVLPVVRGFVTDPAKATPPPATPITVSGTLAPGESPPNVIEKLPPGQMQKINLAVLVNQWQGELYNAFVFAQSEAPDPATASLERIPPPKVVSTGVNWRNFGYALQWWFFAAFALFMWARMVVQEHRDEQAHTLAVGQLDPALTKEGETVR